MMLLTEFAKWGYLFRIQRADDEIKVCNGVAVYDGLDVTCAFAGIIGENIHRRTGFLYLFYSHQHSPVEFYHFIVVRRTSLKRQDDSHTYQFLRG